MSSIKEATNKKAYDRFEKSHHASGAAEKAQVSQRFDCKYK